MIGTSGFNEKLYMSLLMPNGARRFPSLSGGGRTLGRDSGIRRPKGGDEK